MSSTLHFARSLSLSVGMALASSCLGMVAAMSARAGGWVLPAIGVSLLLALAVALAIGRLAKRFPSALGVRTYVKAAFGNTASLFVVFLYLAMIVAVAGVESQLYAGIVQQVLPAVDARFTVLAVFGAVFLLNVFGVEASRNAQLVLVALMLGGLLALSLHGLFAAGPQAWPPAAAPEQSASLPTVAVMGFFLFVGFEWVTSSQSASRQAAAQLPRVLIVSVAVLGGMYLLFAAAALAWLSPQQLATTHTPQMLLAARLWGEGGRWAMLAVSTAAVLMAFNAGVLGASRLLYSLAREGALPAWLAQVDARRAAPVRAIAVTVSVACIVSLLAGLWQASDALGSAAAILICLCYASLLAASAVLARRDGARGTARGAARGATFGIDVTALLLILALLLGMLFDAAAWRASALAAAACAACAFVARRLSAPRQLSQPTVAPQGRTA